MDINKDYFKADGKQIVDMIFDAKMFKDDTTRDDMSGIEELIVYLLQSKFDTYARLAKLTGKINHGSEAK